jgi:hypothetical protein
MYEACIDLFLSTMRGNQTMDHNEVVRQKLSEKYLLEELDGETRDQFEEHFFDCSECALDVRAGSEFVTQSKIVFANPEPAQEAVRSRRSAGSSWLAWLRPSLRPGFAVPVLALLLAVIGYQNLVSFPRWRSARVVPWVAVAMETYGSEASSVTVPQGKGFIILVRIPSERTYVRYMADLYNPAGKLDCSLAIAPTGTEDQYAVLVPEGNREAGNYRISVRGVSASGEIKNLGSAPFTLQTQN